MPSQPWPETEEEPPRGDTTQRLRTIERWLHHAEEALLYAPDAQGETAATPLDARYSLYWVGGGEHQKAGGQATRGSSSKGSPSSCRSGYHRWNTAASS